MVRPCRANAYEYVDGTVSSPAWRADSDPVTIDRGRLAESIAG
jgi:hypothetical protein